MTLLEQNDVSKNPNFAQIRHYDFLRHPFSQNTNSILHSKRTERVNPLQALYYKAHKWHRVKFTCTQCWNEFLGIVKSRNETVQCPNCSEVDDEEFP